MSQRGYLQTGAVVLLLLVLLATAGWAGGAQEAKSTGAVEISLWHRWSGPNGAILSEIFRDFESRNPGITVKDSEKVGEYLVLLQTVIADIAAGGAPPDILIGSYNYIDFLAVELNPVPIDKLAGKDAVQALYSRFEPAVLNLGRVYDTQVGIPFAISNIVLYYNPDLYRAAGLDPSQTPATWDDVFRIGKIIKEKTGKYAIAIQKMDNWADQALIFSNGGHLKSADNKQVLFNDEGSVGAYAMWARLHAEGLSPMGVDEEIAASFLAGDLAMYCTTIMKLLSQRSMAKFELGIAPFPAFTGKPKRLPAGGAALSVFAKDKAKYPAIWKLVDYMTTEEALTKWTKTGYLCVTKAKVPVTPGQEVAYSQVPNAVPWQAMPGGSVGLEIDRIFLDARTKIIYGNVDAKTGLDKAAESANKLLK
jgi:multiple sugar transport system substrate-binding protein